MKNLTKKDIGKWFSGIIDGKSCIGKVQLKDRTFYLCQNVQDGSRCEDRFQFKYSWQVNDGKTENLVNNSIENLKIYNRKPRLLKIIKPRVIRLNSDYEAIVQNGQVKVGCQIIKNSQIIKLYKSLVK